MTGMRASLRSFSLALIIGWIVLAAAGVVYARLKFVPPSLAAPIIAAFLVEYSFYLVPGFKAVRERLERGFSYVFLAFLLCLSALAPYLIYSIPTGQFHAALLVRLAMLVAVVTFWYVVRVPSVSSDLAFLVLVGASVLLRFFDRIYSSPLLNIDVDILGKLMLIRLAASAVLLFRGPEGIGFGFLPTAREWKIGALHFLMLLPIGLPLALVLGALRFAPADGLVWKAVPIFIGMLWVVALSEEFFFRGLLQRWLAEWTSRPQLALVIASVVFGLAHLSFRTFPNWRFAIVSAVAGWFYGRAYYQTGTIRSAMVAHALTNVTMKLFFA